MGPQDDGVGERRAEGYGRLIVNPEILTRTSFPQIREAHQPVGRALTGVRNNEVTLLEEGASEWRKRLNERSVERSAQVCAAWKIPVSRNEEPSVRKVQQLLDQISRGITMGQDHLAQEWLERQLTRPASAKLWGSAGHHLLNLLRHEESAKVRPWSLLDLREADFPNEHQEWVLYAALKATSRYRRSNVPRGQKEIKNGA